MKVKRSILIALLVFALTTQSFAETKSPLQIGAASRIINPQVGDWVQSASVKKRATEIRDNLEANGLYLSDGRKQVLLVSCDLGGLEPPRVIAMREAMGRATGIPPRAAEIVFKWLDAGNRIGLHWREGKHAQNQEDWAALLDFADQQCR
jgi:hypothetical protein